MQKVSAVDLVGVGLNATDTVVQIGEFPSSGAKIEYTDERVMPGGQVATTVVACQTWGMSTRYVGKLGDDDAAALHEQAFAAVGVEARLIKAAGAPSPRSLILVDSHGERTVLCRRDERVILQPQEMRREWVASARILHVDGHDTAAATVAATWAREAGIPVVADLDETYPGVEDLIRKIDYLIVSRDFPLRLMRDTDLKRALKSMQLRYGCRLAAATLGPGGVLAWDGAAFHYRPAYHVPVIDTTGAGDIFHAGFIYGLMQDWTLSSTPASSTA
jgi:sugar/nucleoside kinase (ribokinase family)